MDKLKYLEKLLEQGQVQIALDPRNPFVNVPATFKTQPLLRLNLSYKFSDSNLDITAWGITAKLTFPQGKHICRIPWKAICAIMPEGSAGRAWSEDMPPEYRDYPKLRNPESLKPQETPRPCDVCKSVPCKCGDLITAPAAKSKPQWRVIPGGKETNSGKKE
jgi:hypothetical protein